MKKINSVKEKLKEFIKKVQKDNVSGYAAQSAYYIILSFIPFVIILLTLIQYIGLDKENLYYIIKTIIPTSMNETVLGIIQEVYSKSIGTISLSLFVAIWASSKGFYALYKGLQVVYENKNKSNYLSLKLRTILYTFCFSALIVLALILMVFGRTIINFINERFKLFDFHNVIFILKDLIVIIGLFIFLLLVYKFVPKSKNKFKKQIPGAILASIGWIIISKIFSIYLRLFKGFSIMYGSLTTIILIMMWVYLCIYIILIGAEINNYIYKKSNK